MNEPIITTLLDTDLYKLTMMYAVWKNGLDKEVRYEFDNRKREPFTKEMVDEICEQIGAWRALTFSFDELAYLRSLNIFEDQEFFEYLRDYTPASACPAISLVDGQLNITLVGNWLDTILYEVPILAIVNEVYFKYQDTDTWGYGNVVLEDKIETYNTMNKLTGDLKIAEFGTRRRYSKDWQETVVRELVKHNNGWLVGTSNVDLARYFNIKPIGTMAHEWLQAFQAIAEDDLLDHLWHALDKWENAFGDKLKVALTDSINTRVFIATTEGDWNGWTGFRHDSGCPHEWATAITKSIAYDNQALVFSDGLNPKKVKEIWHRWAGRYPVMFGIGTDFTNDVGVTPLNIVMKIQEYDGKPVSKISDEPAKAKGDNVELLKQFFGI